MLDESIDEPTQRPAESVATSEATAPASRPIIVPIMAHPASPLTTVAPPITVQTSPSIIVRMLSREGPRALFRNISPPVKAPVK